jgi:hypothetical protein
MRLPVRLVFPEAVRHVTEPREHVLADSVVERRVIDVGTGGLGGQRLQFVGLQATITDVLVRVSLLNGAHWTILVRPSQPWVEFTGAKSALEVARTYLVYGVEHIVFGVDHLLFVFGLLLLVQDRWMLLKTVTSFTLAHSLILAVATLGYASAPMLPLNATIALSILFLGPEIVRSWRGETSLTLRHPWLVAFVFGLLHGFGFASALADAGGVAVTGDISDGNGVRRHTGADGCAAAGYRGRHCGVGHCPGVHSLSGGATALVGGNGASGVLRDVSRSRARYGIAGRCERSAV